MSRGTCASTRSTAACGCTTTTTTTTTTNDNDTNNNNNNNNNSNNDNDNDNIIHTNNGNNTNHNNDNEFPSFRTQPLGNITPLPMGGKKRFLSNPAPGENLLSRNLVMETGCTIDILMYYSILFHNSIESQDFKLFYNYSIL